MNTIEVNEPEPKRLRVEDSKDEKESFQSQDQSQSHQPLLDASLLGMDASASELLERLKNAYKLTTLTNTPASPSHMQSNLSITQMEHELQMEGSHFANAHESVDHQEAYEAMRLSFDHLRRDNEKKEGLIQDLVKKLDEAQNTIKHQMEQIKDLQDRLHTFDPSSSPSSSASSHPNSSAVSPTSSIPRPPSPQENPSLVYLQILQHPPTQAVYQRILRPFPTVAVVGVSNLKYYNNLFVEVSLLKQDEHNPRIQYQNVQSCKNGSPLAGDKKNLIGGQLVQRSEMGSTPDTLIVVFRKLKILTTTAQQGGAFFVLKFVLKRYVDNNFEAIPNVSCVISDPMEVFSHTLYLKGRPAPPPPPASPLPGIISHHSKSPVNTSPSGQVAIKQQPATQRHHHSHETAVVSTPSTVLSTVISAISSETSENGSGGHHQDEYDEENDESTLSPLDPEASGMTEEELLKSKEEHILHLLSLKNKIN